MASLLAAVVYAPGFQFKAGEGAQCDDLDGDAQIEGDVQLFLEMGDHLRGTFYLQGNLIHRACLRYYYFVLGYLGEAMQYVSQRRWIDVDAAHDQHIVYASQDAAG